jgi:hypothetical protein
MYLVVTSRVDDSSRSLAAAMGAVELTPADLSTPGWELRDHHGPDRFVASGVEHSTDELRGVLVRLPFIFAQELGHIEEEARGYVAAELTATLKYWLSTLECPIVNPSTAGCLSGPNWRPEHWQRCAASVGVPCLPVRRGTSLESGRTDDGHASTVTIIGDQQLSPSVNPRLVTWTEALAERASTPLLSATYVEDDSGGPRLAWVEPFPQLEPSAADAILRHFDEEEPS